MKWEPLLAMVALLALGMWVVYGPSIRHDLRPDATTSKFTFGAAKGELEAVTTPDGQRTFRFLPQKGTPTPILSEAQLRATFGDAITDQAVNVSGNTLFRALNITSWTSFVWLSVGFLGQMLFFGRMFVQWLVSEKKKQSHIPESFWWFSLLGGVMLFVYFAWRQDPIGVIGQTSGVVIYARNIRLIYKRRRRDARDSERLQVTPTGPTRPSVPSAPGPRSPGSPKADTPAPSA